MIEAEEPLRSVLSAEIGGGGDPWLRVLGFRALGVWGGLGVRVCRVGEEERFRACLCVLCGYFLGGLQDFLLVLQGILMSGF